MMKLREMCSASLRLSVCISSTTIFKILMSLLKKARSGAGTEETPQCAGVIEYSPFYISCSVMKLLATAVVCAASLTAEQTAVRSEPPSARIPVNHITRLVAMQWNLLLAIQLSFLMEESAGEGALLHPPPSALTGSLHKYTQWISNSMKCNILHRFT